MQNKYRTRLFAWIIIVTLSLVGLLVIILGGLKINTNILDLLPNSQTSASVSQATNKFSNRISSDVVFLVSSADKKQAISAAKSLSNILSKSNDFNNINTGIDQNQQMSWASFYYPSRLQVLNNRDTKLLDNSEYQKIYQNALANIYSPMGIANRNLIDNDPFFLYQNYLVSLPKPASNLDLQNGFLMVKKNNRYYILIKTEINGQSFSIDSQKSVIQTVNQAIDKVSIGDVSILKTGMVFYAYQGYQSAHKEISTIGVGSIIGIFLLVLLTFRSISPLFFTLVSALCGFVAAFVVTYFVFNGVFLFTIVFGSSLIGISVDYAFFYYSEKLLGGKDWTPQLGLKRIFWGATLGLLNVIAAFVVISVTPFPGLHQLAVFAIVGLGVSYLTVICFFPYIMHKNTLPPKRPFLLKISDSYIRLWQRTSVKGITTIILIMFLVISFGIYKVAPNDDIHILEATSTELKNNEDAIKSIIGSNIGLKYIVVMGKNNQQLLSRATQVTTSIRSNFSDIPNPLISISDYVPTISTQKKSYNNEKKLLKSTYASKYLKAIGYKKSQYNNVINNLINTKFSPILLNNWLANPVSKQMQFLWLGTQENGYNALAIVLSKNIDTHKLSNILANTQGVYLVDKVSEINNIFKHYRNILTSVVVGIIFMIFIIMVLKYSFRKALFYIIAPSIACLASIAVLGLFNIPLTLFSILALMIVLGIGMDYVIFLAESRDNRFSATMLALSLSAITTILSFGLLSLSSTPAVHYFGVTVLVGISVSFLLSPIVIKVNSYEK